MRRGNRGGLFGVLLTALLALTVSPTNGNTEPFRIHLLKKAVD